MIQPLSKVVPMTSLIAASCLALSSNPFVRFVLALYSWFGTVFCTTRYGRPFVFPFLDRTIQTPTSVVYKPCLYHPSPHLDLLVFTGLGKPSNYLYRYLTNI